MRGIIHILEADGDSFHGIHSAPLELIFMQASVGGSIEIIPCFTKYQGRQCVAFCNEEGKLQGLPINKEATLLWRQQTSTPDVLVGNVLIVTGDEEFMETL